MKKILVLVINYMEIILKNFLNEIIIFKQIIFPFLIQIDNNFYSYNYFKQNLNNKYFKKHKFLIIIYKHNIIKILFLILNVYILKNLLNFNNANIKSISSKI